MISSTWAGEERLDEAAISENKQENDAPGEGKRFVQSLEGIQQGLLLEL